MAGQLEKRNEVAIRADQRTSEIRYRHPGSVGLTRPSPVLVNAPVAMQSAAKKSADEMARHAGGGAR
jgi:hypothetical protein